MADFNSSLPVRTQNNGDVVIEISDGTTPSQKAAVNSGGSLQIAGQGVAGTPAGGVVSVQGISGGTALPISGTVTATNPSVGTNATAGPTSSTQSGGLVSTSSPSYTTGNLEPLSLTLAGALRVDGSAVTQPISGTVTATNPSVSATGATPPASITYIGGLASTTSPTETSGDIYALSLTTAGALRVDGSAVTQPVSGTVTVGSITGEVNVNLNEVGGTAFALGQTTMSGSIPITIASNQSAVASNITQIGGATQSATNPLFVELTNGTAAISESNPLPVTSSPASTGTPILSYTDSASIAVGSSATQTTTAGGTNGLYLQSITVSGSGKFKATVAINAVTKFAVFNSTAQPSVTIPIPNNFLCPTGDTVVITMTNNDLLAQDLYSTVVGIQI